MRKVEALEEKFLVLGLGQQKVASDLWFDKNWPNLPI